MGKGILSADSRQKVQEFQRVQAEQFGGMAGQMFTATPSLAQTIQELIILDAGWVFQKIRVYPVTEIKGQKILMGQAGRVTGRTDTSVPGNTRSPRRFNNLTNQDYELFPAESDVAFDYATLDSWAKFPDFAQRWNTVVRKAIGNDRLKTGWYGTSAADTTDIDVNPNGEDQAPGWLHQIRQYNSGSQYVAGTTYAGTPAVATHHVILGSDAYPNLDYLVAVTKSRIHPVYLSDPNLVVLISQDLVSAEEAAIYRAAGRLPQQKEILLNDPGRLLKNYGGLPSYSPPFLPDGTILVTCWDCLGIYYQDTSWRRLVRDWPDKNEYQDFSSRNEGYVIDDFRETSLIDGITIAA